MSVVSELSFICQPCIWTGTVAESRWLNVVQISIFLHVHYWAGTPVFSPVFCHSSDHMKYEMYMLECLWFHRMGVPDIFRKLWICLSSEAVDPQNTFQSFRRARLHLRAGMSGLENISNGVCLAWIFFPLLSFPCCLFSNGYVRGA